MAARDTTSAGNVFASVGGRKEEREGGRDDLDGEEGGERGVGRTGAKADGGAGEGGEEARARIPGRVDSVDAGGGDEERNEDIRRGRGETERG